MGLANDPRPLVPGHLTLDVKPSVRWFGVLVMASEWGDFSGNDARKASFGIANYGKLQSDTTNFVKFNHWV
jgi:hypothetical protein